MTDPIFTENGSVQVRLSTGVVMTFLPTGDGSYAIHTYDPQGAHHPSLWATGEDMRAIREATGMLALRNLLSVGEAA